MQPPTVANLRLFTKNIQRQTILLVICLCFVLFYRLQILPHFAGWEESDYGNLAMVRGVYDSGFRHFDMNHMPGYYALAALGLFFTDDTELAAKSAALIPNLIATACGIWLCIRHLGVGYALLFVVIATFQPELALYSTSALREPSYSCWLMLLLLALDQRRWLLAGICCALAFTVRFEVPVALLIVFVLAFFTISRRSFFWLGLPLVVSILGWMGYCSIEHGTWQFWGHATEVNVATGGGHEEQGLSWFISGVSVSFKLLTAVLPWRMGLGFWLSLWLGFYVCTRDKNHRWLAGLSFGLLFVWLAIAAVAQHEPQHNLYWKWMYPILLPCFIVALHGLKQVLNYLPRIINMMVLLFVLLQAGMSYYQESNRQMIRSQKLYAPQVMLARWVESEVPVSKPLIIDNIPACYINRRPNEYELISWFDIPTETEGEFAQYLIDNEVPYVLWFQEDWTQAPRVAPFLKDTSEWTHSEVTLELIQSDRDYGWRWFRVLHQMED